MAEQAQELGMDPALLAKWCAALRGELPKKYTQTQRYLRTDDGYCCLGVLHDVASGEWERTPLGGWMTPAGHAYTLMFSEAHGLTHADLDDLAHRNDGVTCGSQRQLARGVDGRTYSFPEQADWIEANVAVKAVAE